MTNQLASLAQRDYFYLDPFSSVNLGTYIMNWSIASSMSSKLEPAEWLRNTGHIGIHGGADGCTYVCTDCHIDGLPYSYGAPRPRRVRSSAIKVQ